MHAVALRQNGLWIDFQFVDSDTPRITAMRHVLPRFRDEIVPVVLATYTDEAFDALMGSVFFEKFTELYDSDALTQIGTGIGFNDFVERWFPDSFCDDCQEETDCNGYCRHCS